MILKWGAFAFPSNTVWFNLHRQVVLSPGNRRYKIRETWHIKGVLTAATQGDLTTAIAALDTEFATDGDKDLIFYLDDGTTPTAHSRPHAGTLNGNRVIQRPSYHAGAPGLWGAGIEYQRLRTFSIVIQSEYADSESTLLAYAESVVYQPTGSEFVIQEVLSGPPIKYTTQSDIRIVGTQRGVAVGTTTWPNAATSLYPTHTRARRSWVSQELPIDFGSKANHRYTTRWHYHFEATAALNASPTLPTF